MSDDWIEVENDPKHSAKEKSKARDLRKSRWWKNILAKGVCHYCDKTFPPAALTMDHIVPISRGGKSSKGNVVPACKECNNNKKYYTPVEMILKELREQKAKDD